MEERLSFLKRKLQDAKESLSKRGPNSSQSKEVLVEGRKPSSSSSFTPTTVEGNSAQDKFKGVDIADLLFIEVFSGTARLSKAAKEAGFQVLPVDKSNKRASQIYTAQYDLSDQDQVDSLIQLIEETKQRIVAVHLAPACGTASRARERPLKALASRGFKVPQPLRSAKKPMGLDSLSGLDKLRTESANLVYAATAQIIRECIRHDILCSLENPENSLFWLYPDIYKLLEEYPGFPVVFRNCMHGGKRTKRTKWWATKPTFSSLAAQCDGSHSHAHWTPVQRGAGVQFPTAEEAAYPHLLCQRVVDLLVQHAESLGATTTDSLAPHVQSVATTSHRWILDMLPRGKKFKPLVSVFQAYVTLLNAPAHDPEQTPFFLSLPKGAKLVHRQLQWGKIRVDEEGQRCWETGEKTQKIDGFHSVFVNAETEEDRQAELCSIGVPREPWDFVERAVAVGHPRSLAIHLSEDIENMLRENFEGEPHVIMKERAMFLNKWTNRCKELRNQEAELHERLAPHLRKVLKGKRLLVFKEILADLHYPDTSLIDDICGGFSLSGWLPKSHVFPPSLKRPTQSMEAVQKQAKGVNLNICKQVSSVQDSSLSEDVWKLTLEEIEKGWVWVDEECDPARKVLAKRFGLKQGEKTRLIDDCTIGGFNSTCGSCERLKVHAIDEMAAYISWCLTNLGKCSMEDVLGKTYDLTSAYKQFGISPSDRDSLRIAVWDAVEKKVKFLGVNALPFGAIGSVSSFLRVAMAIWFIGVRGLRLCWTSFFDDFTILSKQISANNASTAAESLFNLLGVVFAKEGKKSVPWSTRVKTLGLILDLKPTGDVPLSDAEFFVAIGHTESRVAELSQTIQSLLENQRVSRKDAEKLRGRLQWFESFALGRTAQQALRVVSGLASNSRADDSLSTLEIEALDFLRNRVLRAPPTRIQTTNLDTWIVFSDGACEGSSVKEGSIGAVLINPLGTPVAFFSEVLPKEVMTSFLLDSDHPIFELELLPVFIAVLLWNNCLKHSQCVFYVDNEAAQGALIRGSSSTVQGNRLLKLFVEFEMQCQIKVWFARVPTSSNPADKPSRGETEELVTLGASRSVVDWQSFKAIFEGKVAGVGV